MSKPLTNIVSSVVLAGAMAWVTGNPARGDVISLYAFGTSGNAADANNYASTDSNVHSTTDNLVRSSGYGTGTTANWPNPNSATVYSGTNWALRRKSQPLYAETVDDLNYFNDYGRAYAAGTNYLEWTVTPQAGYKMNLDSFTLNVTTSNSRFFYYYLSSSIDGYDVVINSVGGVTASSGSPVVSLTGAQFQNLTSAITFRLWTWGNQSGSSGSAWSLDNLTINGSTVAVPEPAAVALFAIGGLMMIRRRRPA